MSAAGAVPATADEPIVVGAGKPATIVGTPGDDKLNGTTYVSCEIIL